jgi:hypothetical protein
MLRTFVAACSLSLSRERDRLGPVVAETLEGRWLLAADAVLTWNGILLDAVRGWAPRDGGGRGSDVRGRAGRAGAGIGHVHRDRAALRRNGAGTTRTALPGARDT